ncbi:hypothetical protein MK974_06330 [Burkholderia ambifaria]|uniref:hypothetical protein n=1 Tax=Burkholderia ambifaria TaxID=152480 RepID=UPI0022A8F37E|nr:hypothetical protein [Burkholderia ambifaria]WAS55390.1 hypothetical protein MK974_06330 [Burkholderia ambifaria]
MQIDNQNQKRKRVPFNSVEFTDARGGVSGFAKGWYFWVSAPFKPALDIAHNEYIDDEKTQVLRNKKSHALFGVSHDELKERIKASGEGLSDSDDHKRIMSFAIRYLVETQGEPPLYGFRETDGLESRCGEWYVQVEQAIADADDKQGNVGFRLYARNHDAQAGEGVWVLESWLTVSQWEFVELLRTGRCRVVDLSKPLSVQGIEDPQLAGTKVA